MKLQDPLIPIELRIHIDEAWRWPLAGPVWVWGIIQTATCDKSLFRDSKTLTAKRRDELYQIINHKEKEWKFVYAWWHSSAWEIDEYGIIGALRLASIRMIYNLIIKRYRLHLRQKLLESVRGDDIIFVTVYRSGPRS
jgi:ribonuclease HII